MQSEAEGASIDCIADWIMGKGVSDPPVGRLGQGSAVPGSSGFSATKQSRETGTGAFDPNGRPAENLWQGVFFLEGIFQCTIHRYNWDNQHLRDGRHKVTNGLDNSQLWKHIFWLYLQVYAGLILLPVVAARIRTDVPVRQTTISTCSPWPRGVPEAKGNKKGKVTETHDQRPRTMTEDQTPNTQDPKTENPPTPAAATATAAPATFTTKNNRKQCKDLMTKTNRMGHHKQQHNTLIWHLSTDDIDKQGVKKGSLPVLVLMDALLMVICSSRLSWHHDEDEDDKIIHHNRHYDQHQHHQQHGHYDHRANTTNGSTNSTTTTPHPYEYHMMMMMMMMMMSMPTAGTR